MLQTKKGFFLKFLKEEIPEKKKNALGVEESVWTTRTSFLSVYMLESRTDYEIVYKEKQMILNKLKLAKRDTKGTKVRV